MILITGGTGAIGAKLTEHFLREGQKIRLLALPSDNSPLKENKDVQIWYGDVSKTDTLKDVCAGVTTVYHLAAVILSDDEGIFDRVNVGGTKNMLEEAKKAKVQHFIHVSSSSVVHELLTPYSRSKQAAEELVRNSGLNYTIVRPSLAYGRNGGQEFNIMVGFIKRYPVVPVIGDGKAVKRPVYMNDLIEGLIAIHGKSKAYGKTYNLTGGQALGTVEFIRVCLAALGMPDKPVLHLPAGLCIILARVLKAVMKHPPLTEHIIAIATQPADLSPKEAEEDLGYRPHKPSEVMREVLGNH